MHIVPIHSRHNRKAFDCGKPKVNAFLHEKGLSEAYGATWVLVPEPESIEVIGFCTLIPDVVGEDEWDETNVNETSVSLEWFGVDNSYQGQGWGEKILLWVIKQVVQKSLRYPVAGLLLIPLDTDARSWYLRRGWGFVELDDVYLFMAIEIMKTLPHTASTADL